MADSKIKDLTAKTTVEDADELLLNAVGSLDRKITRADLINSTDIDMEGKTISFNDSTTLVFGTGDDATIEYDGTDLIIKPAAVGSGDMVISGGGIEVDDNEKAIFGTGKDATIYYDGTDMIIDPKEVGSGVLSLNGATLSKVGGTTVAGAGVIRLPNNTSVYWRNAGDSGNIGLTANASDQIIVTNILGVNNQGSGSDPLFESNSSTQTITVTDRLAINNQGAGSDPVFSSNSAGQSLNLTGNFGVDATRGIYLDGISNTWIEEDAADDMSIHVGGQNGLRIQETGTECNVVCGATNALATNATNGFLYIPSCAGAPTGTPTSYTGKVPIVFDSTNNQIYVYDGSWLSTAALT